MISEGQSRYSRATPRRAIPGTVEAEVILCGSTVCRAQITDEQGGSLGLQIRGKDADRAVAHRDCCLRRTIVLRVPGEGDTTRDVPAQLIHVSPAATDACKVGVGFIVSCLNTEDIQHLLALWRRFRDADKPA